MLKTFKLLVSFDGALGVVTKQAQDVYRAMDMVRAENRHRTAILVKRIA